MNQVIPSETENRRDVSVTSTPDSELNAMTQISQALAQLNDPKARERVLAWAVSRYGIAVAADPTPTPVKGVARAQSGSGHDREIPGIARLTETGELHLTVRDVKARSANDAAVRIAHVALWANEQLTGTQALSSKNTLVPILRRYRAYDGNTRSALANHRGFIREGDQLSMDLHCRQEAEGFVREILDPGSEGAWNPTKPSRRRNVAARGPASPGADQAPSI